MEKEAEKQYLLEDKDLLDELVKVGPPSTGAAEAGQMHKLASIQIKAALRNRKTAHDLDTSTRKYSLVLIAFAFVQVVLGMTQFLFEATFSAHPIAGGLLVLAIAALFYFTLNTVSRSIDQKG